MSIKKNKLKINYDNRLKKAVESLEKIKDSSLVTQTEIFKEDLCTIIERLKNNIFRLAVIGEFSSGKSTFLNAILENDILKHGVEETTATITEIYNDVLVGDEILFDVYLFNGKSIKGISLERISEFTTTTSKKYNVVQDIEKVVIRKKILENDAKICLVDTPGLNGMADKHKDRTIEQIKNAHAGIYLLNVRGLTNSDINFIEHICKYQNNIIFVQNFIDTLNELEGETPESKIEEQKKIIEEKIKKNNPNLNYKIIAVSARDALISKVPSLYDKGNITKELSEKIYKESKFEQVFEAMNELIKKNVKDNVYIKDTIFVAINFLRQFEGLITFKSDSEKEEWERSTEGINKKNYEKLIKLLTDNRSEYEKKLSNYISGESIEIDRKVRKEIRKKIEKIEKEFQDECDSIGEIDELEKYIEKDLSNKLYHKIDSLKHNINNNINICFDNLLSSATLKIHNYTNEEPENVLKIRPLDVKIERIKPVFITEEQNLSKLAAEIEREKQNYERKEQELYAKREEIKDKEKGWIRDKELLERSRHNRQNEIEKLGVMPEKEIKEIIGTKLVHQEGMMRFVEFILGKKKETTVTSYDDYSKQDDWKRKKNEIEAAYKKQEEKLNDEIRGIETATKWLFEEVKKIENDKEFIKKDISNREDLYNAKKEDLVVRKNKAKNEYLHNLKEVVRESIHKYLYESIEAIFLDDFSDGIKAHRDKIEKLALDMFDISYNERIEKLKNMINQNTFMYEDRTLETIKIIKNSIKELEGLLC